MSTEVQTELDRIESNVAAAYAAAAEQGADMPEAQTTDNLAETVASIKSVKFTEQTLTDDQKAQARTNIGAASQADLDQLSSEKVYVTQVAGESEALVMSQKAVTNLVKDALGSGSTTEYETVDSVDDMTDPSKSYVLSTTGTIWSYGEFTEKKEAENKFVPATAELNKRYATSSISAANGLFVSDYIAVDLDSASPYAMRAFLADGVGITETIGNMRIHYFNAAKTLLGNKYLTRSADGGVTTAYAAHQHDSAGNIYWHIDEQYEKNGNMANNIPICKITEFDISDVAFIRVTLGVNSTGTAITANDIKDVIITFDADAGTIVTRKWYDTGLTPEAAGGGGNYVTLLVKVDQNTSDIQEVSNRVTSLESGSETITVPSFWETAVNAAIAKIKALQVGRNCVTFPFFSDNHQRNGYAGALIAKVMQECHIPYCFFGGDSIDSDYIASEAVMVGQDKKFDAMMSVIPNGRFCRAVGNHDGYWAVSDNENHSYTREQVYELFLREESISQNKHFGDDGTYYYVDDVASRVRFIVLNTNGGSVDDTQLAWFRDVALKVDEGWAVAVISHQPISNHYHANISNAADVRSVVANSGIEVIGWFSGHIHRDRIYTGAAVNTADDSEGAAMGFTQVTITSDHTGIAYEDATKHTVANDDKSHAIDFVTINRNTRTVNLTRLGIGSDRSYRY